MKKLIMKLIQMYKWNKRKLTNWYNYQKGAEFQQELEGQILKKKIFYMLTPKHGNLGDQAIAYASLQFLADYFKEYELIELDTTEVYKYAKAVKKILTKEDLIFIPGGGNMGDRYLVDEIDRRFVISEFSECKVISFPQTINFSDTKTGRKELKLSTAVYNGNSNLSVIAREEKSFDLMKKNFTIPKIILNPDMVLYLNNKLNIVENKRAGIMICLRDDEEIYIGRENRNKVVYWINKTYDKVSEFDTVVPYTISRSARKPELNSIWQKFSDSEVVITDRLHGMIFAAITRTPCLVLRNNDHKIIGSYKWLQELNYIQFIEEYSLNAVEEGLNKLIKLDTVDNLDLDTDYYNELAKEILM